MLRGQAGIHSVKVALLAERGVIEFDPNVWTVDKLVEVSTLLNKLSNTSYTVYRKYRILASMLRSSRPPVQTSSPSVSMG